MTDLLRSEWLKLRTLRVNFVLLLLGLAFVVVVTGLIAAFVPLDDASVTSAEVTEIVGISSILAGLLMSVVGVLAITSEFGHGTIRPTLVATPARTKVFVAKALVLAALAAVTAVVIGVAGYTVGYALLSARDSDGLSFLDGDGTMTVLFVGLPILFVLLTLFGYGLGLLIRLSPVAVTLVVLWPILIESIIGTAMALAGVDDPGRFLPYSAALVLVSPEGDGFSYSRVGGGVFFGLVVAVLVAVAIVVNDKRDV